MDTGIYYPYFVQYREATTVKVQSWQIAGGANTEEEAITLAHSVRREHPTADVAVFQIALLLPNLDDVYKSTFERFLGELWEREMDRGTFDYDRAGTAARREARRYMTENYPEWTPKG